MVNPREYTCRLLEMVDEGSIGLSEALNAALSYMSDSDVEDMMRANQWDDMIVAESTEEDDSDEEAEEDEITIGSTVVVDGVKYVVAEDDLCKGCVGKWGSGELPCTSLPACETDSSSIIFVRKENK